MKPALDALVLELRRLKAAGVMRVPVSEAHLTALRTAVQASSPKREAPVPRGETSVGALRPVPAAPPISPSPERAAGGHVSEPAPSVVRSAPSEPREAVAPPRPRPVPLAKPAAQAPEGLIPKPFTLPAGDKAARWAWLKEHVTSDPVCRAHVRPGKQVVLGVGDLDARIFFVGEAPGAEEEIQGEPFVGPAGELLTRMIKAMGVERSQVYIGNIMNWRPQLPTAPGVEQVGNRPPTSEEMAYCLPYLRAQIEIVAPQVLVALGKTAVDGLLGGDRFKTLGEARGRWFEYGGLPLMVTYHPSYLLRNQSISSKRVAWEDLLQVMERVGLPISEKQRGFFRTG